jgi:hypothetical protein
MPDTSHLIKFAGAGKAAKFGAEFGKIMHDKVNDSVEAIRQKVAAKIAGIDPTGERGDGPEEDPDWEASQAAAENEDEAADDNEEDFDDLELTDEEDADLDADEGEDTDEDSEPNT